MLTRLKICVSTQSPDLLQFSGHRRGRSPDSTVSLSAPSASALAPASAESPLLNSRLDDDACFQRWLDAGQEKGGTSISKRTKRLLIDSQGDSGTDDQRVGKRQRLLSTAEQGMYQPSVCNIASTLADNPVDAHDRCRRLLPTRNNSSYSNNCDNR